VVLAHQAKNVIVGGKGDEVTGKQKRANLFRGLLVAGLVSLVAQFGARSGPEIGAAKVSSNVVARLSYRNGQVCRTDAPGCSKRSDRWVELTSGALT
jgi:hypothetical protein